ncbi:MAG: helix-turn-helix transcriptional regulator [Fibrobacteres bacterium]|nr:helix-turn-helix transcriptional regulator [Fibrobacterota bacterium]
MYYICIMKYYPIGIHLPVCRFVRRNSNYYNKAELPRSITSVSLIIMTEGELKVKIHKFEKVIRPFDVLTTEAGEKYELQSMSKTAVSFYNVGIMGLSAAGTLYKRSDLGINIFTTLANPPEAVKIIDEIIKDFKKNGSDKQEERSFLGLKLLKQLHPLKEESTEVTTINMNRSPEERILSVVDFISKHYKNRMNIKDLAHSIGYHPAHFSRLFKKVMGVTPEIYILSKKIEKAKQHMEEHRDPPSAIAQDFGFFDYSHFYHAFCRYAGTTPSEYYDRESAT